MQNKNIETFHVKHLFTPRNSSGYLPIMQVEGEIRRSILDNLITIIMTPTGSGKTMLTAAWAWSICGTPVYCMVPRVVMAREAEKGAVKLIHRAAWDVAHATGKSDSSMNRAKVVYMTEGSFIARSIPKKLKAGDIICIDEVHEQGAITEALLVVAKDLAKRGVKTVLMSATMDAEKYANYYRKDGISVGTITLPPSERPYPLNFKVVENPIREIAIAAAAGERCIIGVDGKDLIDQYSQEVRQELRRLGVNIPVFGFHGEMETEEQDLMFAHRGAMVVIGTNVLQSGVTVEGLSCGWFNGYGKRMKLVNGRNVLKRYKLSAAENTQWYGRVGRTCIGTVLLTQEQQEEQSELDALPTPEILRANLDDVVLQFNSMGIDIRTADLLHKPNAANIEASYSKLTAMGLLDIEGKNTELGQKVFEQGMGVKAGLIVVLGEKFGIANTAHKIATIVQTEHFCRKAIYSKFRSLVVTNGYSDFMIWKAIAEQFINKYGYRVKPTEFEAFKLECEGAGLFRKNLTAIMKRFERVDGTFNNKTGRLEGGYSDKVTDPLQIKDAVVRIMAAAFYSDKLTQKWGGWYSGEQSININNSSAADISKAKVLVGDVVGIQGRRGVMYFGEGITVIEEHTPIIEDKPAKFNPDTDAVEIETTTHLQGSLIETSKSIAPHSEECTNILLNGLQSKGSYYGCSTWNNINRNNKNIIIELERLNITAGGALGNFENTISNHYKNVLGGVDYVSLEEIKQDHSLECFNLPLESIIPFELDSIDGVKEALKIACPAELWGFKIDYAIDKVSVNVPANTDTTILNRFPKEFIWGGVSRPIVFNFI